MLKSWIKNLGSDSISSLDWARINRFIHQSKWLFYWIFITFLKNDTWIISRFHSFQSIPISSPLSFYFCFPTPLIFLSFWGLILQYLFVSLFHRSGTRPNPGSSSTGQVPMWTRSSTTTTNDNNSETFLRWDPLLMHTC